jgi:cytochrome b subunit of formate dehydrogenase
MNFWVDTSLIILLSIVTITGLLAWFVFPFDSGNDELSMMLEGVHKWTSVTLVFISAYHLKAHLKWYKRIAQMERLRLRIFKK